MWREVIKGWQGAWGILALIAVLVIISAGDVFSQNAANPFPTYGTGAVQVRLYTDYFCPPCRAMEPPVEPVLKDLLNRKVITLTLVDVPLRSYSPLYAQYFLYALKGKNDLEHALKIRTALFEAAASNHVTTKEQIEDIFKSKKIPYTIFDPKSTLGRYNALIKEDDVHSTPTCVIIKGVRKETFVGGPDILKALKQLP